MADYTSSTTEKVLISMWHTDRNDDREFSAGKESWELAAAQAEACRLFRQDVEEELVSDDESSCYNCRYRRWTADSFLCKAPLHGNTLSSASAYFSNKTNQFF